MDEIQRIHTASNSEQRMFTDEQIAHIEGILNRRFKSWLKSEGEVSWNGKLEKLRSYTVVRPIRADLAAADVFKACVEELHRELPFILIIAESGGKVVAIHDDEEPMRPDVVVPKKLF